LQKDSASSIEIGRSSGILEKQASH